MKVVVTVHLSVVAVDVAARVGVIAGVAADAIGLSRVCFRCCICCCCFGVCVVCVRCGCRRCGCCC